MDNNEPQIPRQDHILREERIRQRAHRLWEDAGRPDHKAEEHWAEAERLIDREGPKPRTDGLSDEPNPRGEAIDIGPSPNGDIQTIPTAAIGGGKRR
jgi:hypothetical protein